MVWQANCEFGMLSNPFLTTDIMTADVYLGSGMLAAAPTPQPHDPKAS